MSSSSTTESQDSDAHVDTVPSGLDEWFANHPAKTIDDGVELFWLISNPPLGRTDVRVPTKLLSKHVGLKRCGPCGWTYFPANKDGDRLARIHYQYIQSDKPHRINAIVKLTDSTLAESEEHILHHFKCSSEAILTVDNLEHLGHAVMRTITQKSPAKKRKMRVAFA